MEKVVNKIQEYLDSLTSTQRLLVIAAFVILLFILSVIFVNGNYRSGDINYNKLDSSTIIEKASIVYDRDISMTLDDVVDNILKIHNETWYINKGAVRVKDLYNSAVSNTYKKKVSKNYFTNTLNSIYKNVLGESGNYDANKNYIETIYDSSEYDMYLVKLITDNGEDNYIGIRITDDNYLITFIE